MQGFWVSMNAERAEAMLHDPHIRSIEENAVLHESASQTVGGQDLRCAVTPPDPKPAQCDDPFWHLDRIDQRSPVLDGKFQYCNGATQVYAYIFDKGVRAADPQLNPRVIAGKNATPTDRQCPRTDPEPPPYSDGGTLFDERNPCGTHNVVNVGHGTAVATLLAGSDVGVSKTTKVIPLRLANCENVGNLDPPGTDLPSSGHWIEAFDWLFGSSNPLWDCDGLSSVACSEIGHSRVPAVANFSVWLGTVAADPAKPEYEVESRLRQLIRGGVVVVTSANNQMRSKNDFDGVGTGTLVAQVPARLSYSNPYGASDGPDHPYGIFNGPERVITVGGTMLTNSVDQRWICGSDCGPSDPGSNYGPGVDIWAPADNIQSGHIASVGPGEGDPWVGSQYRRPLYRGLSDRAPTTGCAASLDGNPPHYYARSGTSFASPMVAGAAARLLSEDSSLFNVADPTATAAAVWSRLSASATHLPTTANLGAGSPDLFLYIGGVNFKTQPQSSGVGVDGSATLTAEAVGTNLLYQLFVGQTQMSNHQASGTFTVSPSSTTTYWIQATNTCLADGSTVSGDSTEATIVAMPIVTATATNNTVAVSWTSVGAGTTYDVFRASAGSPFTLAYPNAAGFQLSDTVQPNRTYVYKVRATNGTATAMSKPDYATTKVFTDPDLSVSPTVKALHIADLRSAVNLIAEAMAIPDPYTSAELLESSVKYNAQNQLRKVASADFIDVMTRLNAVRAQPAYGLPALTFASTPVPGGSILKSHLVNLRSAVN